MAQDDAQPGSMVSPGYLSLNEPAWYAEKMAEPAEFTFDDTPLAEVVAEIGRQYAIPIWLDAQPLDDAGLGPNVPITSELSSVSLEAALATLLHEYDLTWTLRNGILVITTPQEAEGQLIVRVYPVRDLVMHDSDGAYQHGDGDFDGLGEVIVSSCSPNTWGEGNTYLPYHEESGTLIIEQTLRVHRQIEDLLAGLRAARQLAHAQPTAAKGEQELVLAVYRLQLPQGPANPEAWQQEFVATLEEMIEPASWQAGGGAGRLRAISGVLFVRQTPEVQAHLRTILHSSSSTFAPGYPWARPLAPAE